MRSCKPSPTLTLRYTDVMRTGAVTAGHGMALLGAAGRAFGIPGAHALEHAGDAVAVRAVAQCSRDTPPLNRCNHGRGG